MKWHFFLFYFFYLFSRKLFVLLTFVNENARLKAEVQSTFMSEWRFTFESWSCRTLDEWMKIHFWKLKLSHLRWVNEDSLLKAEVVAPYMSEWRFSFERWSCRTLHEWMKIHFWKLKLSHLIGLNEDSLLKAEVVAHYMSEWRFTFESWNCRILTWVNEDSLLKTQVVTPYVHYFTNMIFSTFTFESWSWWPLWKTENECIKMHVSNRQKGLCVRCDVWFQTCRVCKNALLYCLCLQRSRKYHVWCLPIPWALTLCIFRFCCCATLCRNCYSCIPWAETKTHIYLKILLPTFDIFIHFFQWCIF